MKKKIYLISYAIIQFVISVYYLVFAGNFAQKQLDMLMKTINMMPAGLQATMKDIYTLESLTSSVQLLAVVGAILAVILLILFIKDKVAEKKTLAIVLTAISIFIASNAIVSLVSVIALVCIATTPKKVAEETVKKEKKKLEKLEPLGVSKKDIILTVVLIVLYLTQFFIAEFINDPLMVVLFALGYYVLVFAFGWFVFKKRLKRDFAAYKSNVGAHVGQAFKWWGILIGCSYVLVFVRIILGGEMITANQSGLNNAPLWYTAPLAIIWAPFVEELIFRGCVRRFIKNDILFIIVSGLIFGLGHTIGVEEGLYNIVIQSFQYVAMGAIMATAYVKTNNIFVNMTIHFIQNTLATVVMAFM